MRTLLVVAHPDDESTGLSHLLGPETMVVTVTDGAPRNLEFARRAGFASREEYRAARAGELRAAVALAQVGEHRSLGIADQETAASIREVVAALRLLPPFERVYTHAYEGGHPDHDAVAFAVHQVWSEVREYPAYHFRNGVRESGSFLPYPGAGATETHPLDDAAAERKRALLACFASQAHVLSRFPRREEHTRRAPRYDFTQPPHAPPLYYETRPHGWTWERWRDAVHRFT